MDLENEENREVMLVNILQNLLEEIIQKHNFETIDENVLHSVFRPTH